MDVLKRENRLGELLAYSMIVAVCWFGYKACQSFHSEPDTIPTRNQLGQPSSTSEWIDRDIQDEVRRLLADREGRLVIATAYAKSTGEDPASCKTDEECCAYMDRAAIHWARGLQRMKRDINQMETTQ